MKVRSDRFGRRRFGTAAAMAAMSVVLAAVACTKPPAPGTWAVEPAAVPVSGWTPRSHFDVLACGGPSMCVALGGYEASRDLLRAARWDGTRWAMTTVPPRTELWLSRVVSDCASPTWCVFFDPDLQKYLVWDGDGWTTGTGARNVLSLSCPAPKVCFSSGKAARTPGAPAVQRWDGTTWSPAPGSESLPNVSDISCATVDTCVATTFESATPAYLWNDGAWTPLVFPFTPSVLRRVECPSPDRCVMTGTTDDNRPGLLGHQTVVAYWLGAEVMTTAVGDTSQGELALSCAGPSSCVANSRQLTAAFDGTAWRIVARPGHDAAGLGSGLRTPLACAAATACFALRDRDATRVDQWDGTSWRDLGQPAGADEPMPWAGLHHVSCAGPTSCLAVGTALHGDATTHFIESWDGTRWTLLPDDPLPPNTEPEVECAGPDVCFLRTTQPPGDAGEPLAVWDGSAWGTSHLSPVDGPGWLGDLWCGGPRSCLALGWIGDPSDPAGPFSLFAQAWDGSAWTPVAAPLTPTRPGFGSTPGSCASPTFCAFIEPFVTTVGPEPGAAAVKASAQVWNGRVWRRTPVPPPPGGVAGSLWLRAIDCVAADACIALGSAPRGPRPQDPVASVAARWNGRAWTTRWLTIAGADWHPTVLSCATATRCLAITDEAPRLDAALDLAWTGDQPAASTTALPEVWDPRAGLSCTPSACAMVGSRRDWPRTAPVTARYRFG